MKEFYNLFNSLNYNIKKYNLKVFNSIINWNETRDFIIKLGQSIETELINKKHTKQELKGLLNCLNLINVLQKGKYDN